MTIAVDHILTILIDHMHRIGGTNLHAFLTTDACLLIDYDIPILVLGDSPNRTNFDAGAQMQATALAVIVTSEENCCSITVLKPFIVVILQGELSIATAHDMGNLSPGFCAGINFCSHDLCHLGYQRRSARTAQADFSFA
ncbi:hypothetical protein SDC9_89451 [bioreactor metagenome]|uniref:Uncharacterized protein n=1 Tax=bioreactor metagenome TaxID=1076179 RepID=A0A644ZPB4_9ZZZZ